MNLTRRRFLTLAGSGIAVAALPAIVEPVRRFWQVSRKAPVGPGAFDRAIRAHIEDHRRHAAAIGTREVSFRKPGEPEMYFQETGSVFGIDAANPDWKPINFPADRERLQRAFDDHALHVIEHTRAFGRSRLCHLPEQPTSVTVAADDIVCLRAYTNETEPETQAMIERNRRFYSGLLTRA